MHVVFGFPSRWPTQMTKKKNRHSHPIVLQFYLMNEPNSSHTVCVVRFHSKELCSFARSNTQFGCQIIIFHKSIRHLYRRREKQFVAYNQRCGRLTNDRPIEPHGPLTYANTIKCIYEHTPWDHDETSTTNKPFSFITIFVLFLLIHDDDGWRAHLPMPMFHACANEYFVLFFTPSQFNDSANTHIASDT